MDSNKRVRDLESLDELLSIEFAANEIDLNAQLAEVRSKVKTNIVETFRALNCKLDLPGCNCDRCCAADCGEDRQYCQGTR